MRCPHHGAGVGDVHPLPDTDRPARPARVDQPDRDVVALEAVDQHRRVFAWVAGQERRSETGGEGGGRLHHADLGPGELGGVATDEVVGRLFAGEPRDGRQDTEGIGGEEDHRARRARDAGLVGIADEVERVGAAGVLGEPLRVEIEGAGGGVEVDVLEDRPEPPRGGEDVGLVHRRQADRLGVAAALEVEGEPVAPAVLVIADQAAQRIGRERRLARPRQPEEDGRVAIGSDVDRRMHRQDALVGHQVVHDREGALLDLAGVLGPDDDHLHPLEVDEDRGPGPRPLGLGIRLERRDADDREVRREAGQLLRLRPPEEVPGEDARPRPSRCRPAASGDAPRPRR